MKRYRVMWNSCYCRRTDGRTDGRPYNVKPDAANDAWHNHGRYSSQAIVAWKHRGQYAALCVSGRRDR